jgi:hypothetical protein
MQSRMAIMAKVPQIFSNPNRTTEKVARTMALQKPKQNT